MPNTLEKDLAAIYFLLERTLEWKLCERKI